MSRLIPVVAAALRAAASTSALAQVRPMVDVAAGIAGGKGMAVGVVAQVAFEFLPTARLPVGLRVDASHHQLHDGFLDAHGTHRASAATPGLVYRLPTARVRPYVLADIGWYAVQGLGLNPGWNLGGGLEVPPGRYSIFGEVRGHFLITELRDRLTPLVPGIRF
ncbi:MAG: hypothetical protein ACYC2G_14335 [Gemmatimonadaceae bacterium]